MAKKETLPLYLYSNKISEVAEKTEACSVHVVRSSDIEKKVSDVAEQHKVPKVESPQEEQADNLLANQGYVVIVTRVTTS